MREGQVVVIWKTCGHISLLGLSELPSANERGKTTDRREAMETAGLKPLRAGKEQSKEIWKKKQMKRGGQALTSSSGHAVAAIKAGAGYLHRLASTIPHVPGHLHRHGAAPAPA